MKDSIEREKALEIYSKIKSDLISLACIYLIISLLSTWYTGDFERDSTDGESRSNMALRIDALTGCHYLESSKGNLTPRLDRQGHNICRD